MNLAARGCGRVCEYRRVSICARRTRPSDVGLERLLRHYGTFAEMERARTMSSVCYDNQGEHHLCQLKRCRCKCHTKKWTFGDEIIFIKDNRPIDNYTDEEWFCVHKFKQTVSTYMGGDAVCIHCNLRVLTDPYGEILQCQVDGCRNSAICINNDYFMCLYHDGINSPKDRPVQFRQQWNGKYWA